MSGNRWTIGDRAYRLALIATAAVAGGLAAACGSAATTSSTPPAGSPATGAASHSTPAMRSSSGKPTSCSVITQAEASAALGQPVRAPILGKATVEGGVACVYYGPQ